MLYNILQPNGGSVRERKGDLKEMEKRVAEGVISRGNEGWNGKIRRFSFNLYSPPVVMIFEFLQMKGIVFSFSFFLLLKKQKIIL